ncbi:MAG: Bor family protein [Gemmatimonadales bacterium]
MNRVRSTVLLATLVLAGAGCYHATIQTGAAPSTTVIYQSFASSWIYGLVPPKTVETMEQCPSGVATVETQQSFVNGLVAILTLGIYTPMEIKVTCAAAGTALAPEISLPPEASPSQVTEALNTAIRTSKEEGRRVTIGW